VYKKYEIDTGWLSYYYSHSYLSNGTNKRILEYESINSSSSRQKEDLLVQVSSLAIVIFAGGIFGVLSATIVKRSKK
jgi:hypothetical protein